MSAFVGGNFVLEKKTKPKGGCKFSEMGSNVDAVIGQPPATNVIRVQISDSTYNCGFGLLVLNSGACFSKVPKLFGRISGDIILFVSSKQRRLEARNFAIIFIFIPFTTYEKTSFTE